MLREGLLGIQGGRDMYYIPKYTIGGYLCHHGILKQKWGVRNGPPYPLSYGAHTAAQKKANPKSVIGGGSTKSKEGSRVGNVLRYWAENEKSRKLENKAYTRKYRMENNYLLKPIIDPIDRKAESKDHLVETINYLEKLRKKDAENFDPFEAMAKIDKSLSKKEQDLLGVGNDNSTDDIQFFFNKDKTAYLITADYHGKYKDEHPISGKIIGIAAEPGARGTGATDKLISDAKKKFPNDRLVAEIDKGNVASRKLFERNGFKKVKEDNGVDYYIYGKRR